MQEDAGRVQHAAERRRDLRLEPAGDPPGQLRELAAGVGARGVLAAPSAEPRELGLRLDEEALAPVDSLESDKLRLGEQPVHRRQGSPGIRGRRRGHGARHDTRRSAALNRRGPSPARPTAPGKPGQAGNPSTARPDPATPKAGVAQRGQLSPPQVVAWESRLQRCEELVEQFRIDIERFWNGALPIPPEELKAKIQREMRDLRGVSLLGALDQFRLGTLEGRFNSLSELYGRRLREREEGRGAVVPRAAAPAAPAPIRAPASSSAASRIRRPSKRSGAASSPRAAARGSSSRRSAATSPASSARSASRPARPRSSSASSRRRES